MRVRGLVVAFCILSILPRLIVAAEPTLRGPVGKLVVTNVEGSATIGTSDTTQVMQERGVYDAAKTVIETRPNDDPDATDEGFVTVVLSNGTALYLEPGSRIEVREFSQQNFRPSRSDMDIEPSISNTRLFLSRGLMAISTSEMLPGSSVVVETPHGEVNVRGRKIVLQTDETSTRVAMFEGGCTVQPRSIGAAGIASRTLHAGEEMTIRSASTGQPPEANISAIPQTRQTPFSDRVAMANIARRMVYFETVTAPAGLGIGALATPDADSQDSVSVSAFSEPSQQIVPVIVVPVDLPVQFTVSPSRLR